MWTGITYTCNFINSFDVVIRLKEETLGSMSEFQKMFTYFRFYVNNPV